MAFDRKSGAATTNGFGPSAAGMGVGKQTLTQQLAMAQPSRIQNKGGDAQDGDAEPKVPVGTSIENTLTAYQQLGISVQLPNRDAEAGRAWDEPRRYEVVYAAAPYWNSRYTDAEDTSGVLRPTEFNPSARKDALDGLGYGPDDAVMAGKGSPDEIKAAIRGALALVPSLIPRPAVDLTAGDDAWLAAWRDAINTWLVNVGIGIDCSGFVYNALLEVRDRSDVVTSGAAGHNGILDQYPTAEDGATVASDELMAKLGEAREVGTTAANFIAPGDTIYLPDSIGVGHVIIVISVTRPPDGPVSFTAAESAAGENGERGGLGTHTWQFIEGAIQRDDGATWSMNTDPAPKIRHQVVPATASGAPT